MRKFLRDHGYGLLQDITNPHSGTICGWIATGGLGIGAFKDGHVKNSGLAIRMLRPNGEWQTVLPTDEMFATIFGSEGQIGIIAGAVLKVQKQTYVSKPYAFSFENSEAVNHFVQLLNEWQLRPSSLLYFDPNYLEPTREIEKIKLNSELPEAIESGDAVRIARIRQDLDTVEKFAALKNVMVLEFDSKENYQKALKYPLFPFSSQRRRYRDLLFTSLPTTVAHKLWEHRYQPGEKKPQGPSMLGSEVILPLEKFPQYLDFIQSAITSWTGNPVKTEGHVLNEKEILLQTIILADTKTFRHKLYLGLVPFMTQTAVFFGGHPYGFGIWNLPFLKGAANNGQADKLLQLINLKNQIDPNALINQGKFINTSGRKLSLRAFKEFTPALLSRGVRLLYAGKPNGRGWSFINLG